MNFSQAPSVVCMVRPAAFGFNPETAATNAFQHSSEQSNIAIHGQALREFDTMVDVLRANDVEVVVVADTPTPVKPDAVFPNNWISFHHDERVVLYPMMAVNRRHERLLPVLDAVKHYYTPQQLIDLTPHEAEGKFLEGTGSIVFDYVHKIAYAARSPRTDETVLKELCAVLNFKPVVFDAVDEQGQAIYHTNVMMCVGSRFALVCLDAIKNDADQEAVLDSLTTTNHRVIAISYEQMKLFAGNMIEVLSKTGEPLVLLSDKAYKSLLPGQLDALSKLAEPIALSIPTIEQYGGGSVRCMVAGVFTN